MPEMKRHENIYIRLPDSMAVLLDISPSAGAYWYCAYSIEVRFCCKREIKSISMKARYITLWDQYTVYMYTGVYCICILECF